MTQPDAPGRFIEANGVRQHYLEYGSGERHVVICHKVTAGAETWCDKAELLASKYHLIIPDLRGHGYSDKPEWGYSLVDYGQDIAALIAALGIPRPVVVGHSLGGRIALYLAARHRDALSAAVAIDPPVSGPGRRRYPYSLESFYSWRKDVEARGVEACLSSNPSYDPKQAALRAKYGLMHSMNAMQESWFGFHLESIHDLIPQITVPAMIMYADRGVIRKEKAASSQG